MNSHKKLKKSFRNERRAGRVKEEEDEIIKEERLTEEEKVN